MNRVIYCILIGCSLMACKGKKKEPHNKDDNFFNVTAFLKSQVAAVDTSLYRIIKVETDGNRTDTSFIPREEFSKYAADFTSVPDISSGKLKDGYTSTKILDTLLGRAILSYTAAEDHLEIRTQDITIDPQLGSEEGSQVKTIYIHQVINKGDSSVEKKMFWEVGQQFTITTRVAKENEPEKIKKLEVRWE